jgi:hypothetical protein
MLDFGLAENGCFPINKVLTDKIIILSETGVPKVNLSILFPDSSHHITTTTNVIVRL